MKTTAARNPMLTLAGLFLVAVVITAGTMHPVALVGAIALGAATALSLLCSLLRSIA